ncbi:oligoendopeptidase F, plasmid [Oxobacter pfennigii]|uniref:Oligoendopeptidase F, plasmid n=1 Tax=Oxobacter pfennigii TaxID=36849 RepID=A0A0N8NTN2_9CLOT|nr:M3 family oligoendopeptidase [Oxobacter pfennigii]KPU45304.1 oligoendopeptidase F, plasmid [Oxobacter pfennigii]
MDLRWSLKELYSSFESREFKGDFEKLNQDIENIKHWVDKNLKNTKHLSSKIEEYIHMLNNLLTLFSRLSNYASLTMSVDAKNEKAAEVDEKLDEKIAELTSPQVKFQKWLTTLDDLNKIIKSSPIIKEHEFFLKELKEKGKYLLSEKEEVLISKMKNTGSNAWTKLQNLLVSTLLVDIVIDGEEKHLPLPVIRNMAYESNKDLRKAAFDSELKAYKKLEESSAACLNGIKGEVQTLSKLRGFSSPLEKTLIDSRMDMETLDTMLKAMVESLPHFEKYYIRKAEVLGHKNGLPFYDIFAPMGNVNMQFTYGEAREYIVKNFSTFSRKLGDFANTAFEKGWIDAEPREGKRGGAFCSNLHVIKESRILTNFTGSFSNVTTLAHELGHGYHGACLTEVSYLNSDYPMPIAETASTFCETIIMNAAIKTASKEEAFTLLETNISDAGQVIVDIYSRFLFESELFERRKESSPSVKELKEMMLNAQKKAYGSGLDPEFLHPYMWINKPHYYYADSNFYNFPYAFGLLFSKGLYAEYLKRGAAFVEQYDKLLSITGKNNLYDIAKSAGVDIHSIDFWRSSLSLVIADIYKFIEMSKN